MFDAEQLDQYVERGAGQAGRLTGIGAAIRTVVSNQAIKRSLSAHRAIALWPQIAGEQLSKVCAAESVRDGVLFVKAKSSAWSNELTFHKPDLIKKLGVHLGAGIVTDIHFSTSTRQRQARPARQAADAAELVPEAETNKTRLTLAPIDPASAIDPKLKLRLLIERTESIVRWRREHGWVECSRCHALYEPVASKTGKIAGKSTKRSARNSAPRAICDVCEILANK